MPDPRMPRAPGNREQMSGYGETPPNGKPLPHVGAGVNPTDAGGGKDGQGPTRFPDKPPFSDQRSACPPSPARSSVNSAAGIGRANT